LIDEEEAGAEPGLMTTHVTGVHDWMAVYLENVCWMFLVAVLLMYSLHVFSLCFFVDTYLFIILGVSSLFIY